MELLTTLLLYVVPLVPLVWLLPERWQLVPIRIATAIFLAVHSPASLILLVVSTTTSWFLLTRFAARSGVVLIVILQAVVMFIFFKLEYGRTYNLVGDRIIPIGLSYYSFRQIHFAIEAYKHSLPQHSFNDYVNFLFFLPTLLVGPINRFGEFRRDSMRRRWDAALFSNGLERILYGYAKIVIVGNYLLSNRLEELITRLHESWPWLATYLDVFKFFGNAYMQFAGFSDVAIGLSLLLGFRINENFNRPFMATNIGDFWNRWHMSLSTWCRDYVYFPIMAITRSPWMAILCAMVILGGWHEISLRFILWGMLHAAAINGVHLMNKTGLSTWMSRRIPFFSFFSWLCTMHFVAFSFILISEDHLAASMQIFQSLTGIR